MISAGFKVASVFTNCRCTVNLYLPILTQLFGSDIFMLNWKNNLFLFYAILIPISCSPDPTIISETTNSNFDDFFYQFTVSSKYSISQKLFSKLTAISPFETQDNFQINIQKITQIRKSWAPLFSNQKMNVGSRQW